MHSPSSPKASPAATSALKRIAKGAGAVLSGSATGMLLQFVSGVVVIRILTRADYGSYALAFSLVSVAASLGMLGLGDAVSQRMAGYIAERRTGHVWGAIYSGLAIVGIGTALLAAFIFLEKPLIARIFGQPELVRILELLALVIPPFALAKFVEAAFRAFDVTAVRVWFNEIGLRVVRIVGILIVAVVGGGLTGVLWATVVSYYLIAVALVPYCLVKLPSLLPVERPHWIAGPLLVFALPLLGVSIVNLVVSSASTLLLGYLTSASTVALYSAPLPFSRFISLPLTAMVFLYLPVATTMVASSDRSRLTSLYRSAARWSALFALPLLLVFSLDPAFVLGHLLGSRYIAAAGVLRLLSLGFFVHCAVGPNGMTLLAFGGRRTLFLSVVLAAASNVLLGMLLIPIYGAEGAAAATALALGVQNVVVNAVLWGRHAIRPYARGDLRTLVLPGLVAAGLYVGFSIAQSSSVGVHLLYYAATAFICLLAPFVLRTATRTDLDLLQSLERRLTGRTSVSASLFRWSVR